MRSKLLLAILCLLLSLLALLAIPVGLAERGQRWQPASYTITDLGTLPGGNLSQATLNNNNGLITGVSTIADGSQHAVMWVGGQIVDMATPGLGGPNSGAFGITAAGTAAGWAENSTPDPNNENFCAYFTGLECRPFIWRRGVMTPLPLLGGNNGVSGPVNNRGEVAGFAENSTRDLSCPSTPAINGTGPQVLDFKPVIWGPTLGQIRQLQLPPGDTMGMALWINDHGQAVGTSGTCANTYPPPFAAGPRAVLWDADGSVQDLGNLGGTANPDQLGIGNIAFAINDRGQVTGTSALPGSLSQHAFFWTRETGMQDLGTLPGDFLSAGLAMNGLGAVVGASWNGPVTTDGSTNPRAFLWQNGVMTDLNAVSPADSTLYLLTGFGVNDAGQIVGFGLDLNTFEIHGFLATPIPGNGGPAARGATKPPALPEGATKALQRQIHL
jgi:probable HAF family extracellular repeat protein